MRDAHHASLAERVDFIEKQLGDSADRHGQELKAAHAKLDQLHGRLMTCDEQHGKEVRKETYLSAIAFGVSLHRAVPKAMK